MLWPYQYTLSIWPLPGSAVLFLFLGHYACPFVFLSLGLAVWAIAAARKLRFSFELDYAGLSFTGART